MNIQYTIKLQEAIIFMMHDVLMRGASSGLKGEEIADFFKWNEQVQSVYSEKPDTGKLTLNNMMLSYGVKACEVIYAEAIRDSGIERDAGYTLHLLATNRGTFRECAERLESEKAEAQERAEAHPCSWERVTKEKVCIYVSTKKEAKKICDIANSHGLLWPSKSQAARFLPLPNKTCYELNTTIRYCDELHFLQDQYTVITAAASLAYHADKIAEKAGA